MRFRLTLFTLVSFTLTLVLVHIGPARASTLASHSNPPEKKSTNEESQFLPSTSYRGLIERQESFAPSVSTSSDHYGYTWDDTQTHQWKDITTDGSVVYFDQEDDGFSGLIPIGFDFKFYENTYNQVYINTNGYITFEKSPSELTFSNTLIPEDTQPNNIIAPMWDDLVVGGGDNNGEVYFKTGGSEPNRYFIVEWYEVSRLDSGTELLTFEIRINENGDILFQYDSLNGVLNEATVGIEDADGGDGLLYLYNTPLLGNDIYFTRPDPSARVKALPFYQSDFITGSYVDFPITITNIGEIDQDTFDLIAILSDSDWDVSYYSQNGQDPLSDSDYDGIPDTGLIGRGDSITIIVRCHAHIDVEVGDYILVDLSITSSLDQSKSASVSMQSAIPAPYAQAYTENPTGMKLELISDRGEIITKAEDYYSGSTLALSNTPLGKYIYVWERNNEIDELDYTDVEYILIDNAGHLQGIQKKLTDNHMEILDTHDRVPVTASIPDGRSGVVWIRDIVNNDYSEKYNVYFALLDAKGDLVPSTGILNITNNLEWRGFLNPEAPLLASPRVTAISNTRFLIVWSEQRLLADGEVSSIRYAIYDAKNNSLIKYPTTLTTIDLDVNKYFDPNVANIDGDKSLVTYTIFNHDDSSYAIAYLVLDSNGNLIKSETEISEIAGWGPDVTQLSTGNILLTWTNPENNTIAYVLIDKTSFAVTNGPIELSNPNPRLPDYVSVTYDNEGHGILTWMDAGWNQYLYYALIGSGGAQLTPPMIFHKGHAADPLILSSYSGYGNAPYEYSGQIFLPMIKR